MTTSTSTSAIPGTTPRPIYEDHPATKPLMEFLQDGKSDNFFEKLYESEAVCLGLFRCVQPLVVWSARLLETFC